MAKLSRKSLMVDDEKIKELARQRGISELAAVREQAASFHTSVQTSDVGEPRMSSPRGAFVPRARRECTWS